MELSELIFTAKTDDLERVSKVIGGLVTDISKLDKASQDAAKTEATLARAAKDNAKANLDNAKAQDTLAKTMLNVDKAANAAAIATEKKAKATERATVAAKRNVDMLQLQNDTYDFILEGFSKGDAKVLAMAKATGQLSDQLKQVLTDIRQFSKNTFDQTETGLDRMVKSAKEASTAQGFLNQGFNLTAKQAKELGNDLDRLNIRLQHQGKSYDEIVKAQAVYKQQFLEEAKAVNQANNALATVEKQRKEVVTATNYLIQADQKMAAALNTSNAALDKAGTDSLVKYETALRKSGISQDLVTAKLAKYKIQLAQVQVQEQARREQHLTRALAPQATDVAVSLWSGQNPFTVLLQQGGQVNDLFMQSGISAEKFGEVVKKSMASMLPSILTVAKGVGGLIVEGFIAAGSAITGFLTKITLFSAASDTVYKFLASDGPSVAAQRWAKLSDILSKSVAVGFAAVLTVLIAMAVEYKNIIQSEGELSKVLATSGGAMGLSKDQAVAYAESMKGIGVGTLKAMEAITEFTKVGKVGKDGLDLIIKSAIELEKYAGVAITETAKKFSELQDEPTKALVKFAESNGYVSASVLDTVASLEQQGDKTAAATAATEAMRLANLAMADEAKSNLSPLETLWLNIKSAINSVKQEIYDLTTSNSAIGVMQTVWETLAVIIAEVWFTIKGVGKEIGGVAAQIAAVMRGDFAEAGTIGEQMKADAKSAREEQDNLVQSILNRGAAEKKNFAEEKEQNSQYAAWFKDNEKALERQYSKEERLGLKKKQLQNDLNAGIIDEAKYKAAVAGWERIIMGERKSHERQKSATSTLSVDKSNEIRILEDTYNRESQMQEKFLSDQLRIAKANYEMGYMSKAEYLDKELQLIHASQAEQKALSEKVLADREQLYVKEVNTLLMAYQKRIDANKDLKNSEQANAEALQHVTNGVQNAYRAYEAFTQKVKDKNETLTSKATAQEIEAMKVLNDQVKKTTEAIAEYNRVNVLRIQQKKEDIATEDALRWATPEQAAVIRAMAEETKFYAAEISKFTKLAKAAKETLDDTINRFGVMSPQAQVALKSYNDAMNAVNQTTADQRVAVEQAATDAIVKYQKDEYKRYVDGISDSIVTALFEGGKAGSKKLRDLVINELKKPVTLVVNAVINTLLGSVMGSLFGGAASSAVGSAGSSLLGSAAASAGGSLLAGATGIGTGTSLMGGFSGSILPAGMVGPSVAAPTLMSGLGNALSAVPGWGWILAGAALFGKKLFGRTLKDVGIQGTFGGESGFQGESYRYYRGGLFRSDKTTTEALDEGTRKQLGDAFIAMRNQVTDFAKVLGLNTDKLKGFTSSIKISLSGLKDNEIEAKLQEALATANNELAEQVIGTWETTTSTVSRQIQSTFMETEAGAEAYRTVEETITSSTYVASEYAREGEKAIDTLTRLATSLSTVNSVFENLGVTLFQSSLAGADLASALVDAFGGIETFISATSYFYDNFYSDTEKFVNQQRQLTSVFNQFGVALPQSKEEFRRLLESIDLTTASGREMYAALMKIAPGFVQFLELTSQLGTTIDDSAEAARRAAEEARQNALSNLDKALSNLRSAINAEKSSINEDLNAAKQVQSKIKSVFDTLSKAIENLYQQATDPVMAAEQGNAFISAALKAAQASGALPDNEELQKAIAAATGGFGIENYSSLAERRYAQLKLAGELEKLKTLTGDQLSDSEYQIELLEDQLEKLDDTLKYWEQQVEAAKGGIEAVMSVESAIVAMQVALQTVLEDGFGAIVEGGGLGGSSLLNLLEELAKQYSPNTPKEALEQLVKSISEGVITKGQGLNLITGTPTKSDLYRQNVESGSMPEWQYYSELRTNTDILISQGKTADELAQLMITMGISLTDMAKAYGVTAAEIAANLLAGGATVLPQLAVGTNYLPDDMVIQAHKGERIIPKADNEQLMRYISGGGSSSTPTDNSALIIEIRALRVQNERLEARLDAIQQNTKVTSDVLDQVTEGGNTMRTRTV